MTNVVLKNLSSRVVNIQKSLEIGKIVGSPDLIHAAIGQPDSISLRQRHHHLGIKRPFDV